MSKIIYTKQRLEEAAQQSKCFSEMFRLIGARLGGNTYQRIKSMISDFGIDTSHFIGKRAGWINSGLSSRKLHFSEVLVDGKERREYAYLLRRALIESGRDHVCQICRLPPSWNGRPLTLEVDHINGNWRDCREANLRFLCPNCHDQVTHESHVKKQNRCVDCSKKISSKASRCKRCCKIGNHSEQYRKVKERPSIELLLNQINQHGYSGTGRLYGVSDNAIRKWLK